MYKILIVEDDKRLNQAVCKYLNDHGYNVVGVLDTSEAYDAMYHTKFDLIISDIMMPGEDGFEFAETVRSTDHIIPIKFTERGGTITLTQVTKDDGVWVTVSDTGCGMDEQTLRHIFDKFYQGDSSHSQEGYGLGLALTKKVLDLNNGKIVVSSSPGEGSEFSVCLKHG